MPHLALSPPKSTFAHVYQMSAVLKGTKSWILITCIDQLITSILTAAAWLSDMQYTEDIIGKQSSVDKQA